MLLILTIILVVRSCIGERNQFVETDASQPDIDVQLLDVNPYSSARNRERRSKRRCYSLYCKSGKYGSG